jgi:two-component system, chemotaxis family, sensor kinase CheA
MDSREEAFRQRLFETFRIETSEHIEAVSSGLLELEKAPSEERRDELAEMLFREAHSMKGAARTVNLPHIEAVCRALESIFSAIKKKEIEPLSATFDILHRGMDLLLRALESTSEQDFSGREELRKLVQQLEWAAKGQTSVPEAGMPDAADRAETEMPRLVASSLASGMTRIQKEKLDSVLLQAEEMLSAKLAVGQRAEEMQRLGSSLLSMKAEWSKTVQDMKIVEKFLARSGSRLKTAAPVGRILEFLRAQNDSLVFLHSRVAAISKDIDADRRTIGLMVDNLLDNVKNASMLPFATLLDQLPRVVRDLSQTQGKEVELSVHGAEIEIDRRILDEMKDPFIHLLRNSIDHGIEKPDEREKVGKERKGKITIEILPLEGRKISIRIDDDGSGIAAERIKAAAVGAGIMNEKEAETFDEAKIPSLIFRSGVSTSPIITDISGRGLGLAIVSEKVEKLGGIITCTSQPGRGTSFLITVPLTIATLRGVLVRAGEQLYVIPSLSLEGVLRVRRGEIKTIENREVIFLEGTAVPLVSLAAVLELRQPPGETSDSVSAVVLGSFRDRIAFIVDEVIHEQEILVKDLGKQLVRVRNVAGSTILGTGRIVPVLNVRDLMKSAVKISPSPMTVSSGTAAGTKRKSILVVEDSITARTLLRSILEAAGYRVGTAVDGIDGYTALRTGEYDLVVSDVDMPRMSGFELTTKIREDSKYAELPVILVTALESREDRELGIDAGANAYIVKSSFDQSNLLEVIGRFI